MSNIDMIRLEIIKMRELAAISAVGNHTDWLESRIATCGDILAFIDSLPEETKDAEQEAARYERENRQSVLSSVDIVNAFIEGARWQANQLLKDSHLPEK